MAHDFQGNLFAPVFTPQEMYSCS